jgi:hypothetical protein
MSIATTSTRGGLSATVPASDGSRRSLDHYDAPSLMANQAQRRFHVMVKPGSSTCNLDCKYCFYLSKEALPNGPGAGRMSDETLESVHPAICRRCDRAGGGVFLAGR